MSTLAIAGRAKSAFAPVWHRLPDNDLKQRLVTAKLEARLFIRTHGSRVRIDQIYLGGTRGHSAREFGDRVGDPAWTTTRVVDGPHADLYRRFADGADPTGWRDPSIPYVDLALRGISGFGEFCGCTDTDDVEALIVRRHGLWARDAVAAEIPEVGPAVVRPIRGTDTFEVVDGHHRLARAWERGMREVLVDVTWSTSPPPRL